MRKVLVLIITLLSLTIEIFAQKSPVKFLNNTCTINVDTTYGGKIVYKHLIDLKYKFVNIGEHLTFIDAKDAKNFYERLPHCIQSLRTRQNLF